MPSPDLRYGGRSSEWNCIDGSTEELFRCTYIVFMYCKVFFVRIVAQISTIDDDLLDCAFSLSLHVYPI